MLSRVFTSSALLKEPSRVAHALKAIGLCAKAAIMLGVNPMFLLNASRVDLDSAGNCSGLRTVVRVIVFLRCIEGVKQSPVHRPLACAASAANCRCAPAQRSAASRGFHRQPGRTRDARL